MTYTSIEAWWWPYLFIAVAGWAATDSWRFLGVYLGGRISETSEIMVLVRCVATAFVAAVIGNLILFPNGELGETPIWLRILAAGGGFAAFMFCRQKIMVGIITAEIILCGGLLLGL